MNKHHTEIVTLLLAQPNAPQIRPKPSPAIEAKTQVIQGVPAAPLTDAQPAAPSLHSPSLEKAIISTVPNENAGQKSPKKVAEAAERKWWQLWKF